MMLFCFRPDANKRKDPGLYGAVRYAKERSKEVLVWPSYSFDV